MQREEEAGKTLVTFIHVDIQKSYHSRTLVAADPLTAVHEFVTTYIGQVILKTECQSTRQ
ncbi:hypothetical protein PRIPAC_84089 [Pristionchus pacificus]|uniref:Uncharacterized protein n=1 Tax=Pristionchus pacificus TaxID=54126 RepID=A0A2A6BM99_PRIPA|nr:hypothetical protein PRIPAC_84089 [Pristionchus pacificus]|eukprot:PDM66968.1 hypothetical protein PRIPAC_48385 [Pristionchus pacificus]